MRVLDSSLQNNFLRHYSLSMGELYFFENYVIAEFNEGVLISYESVYEVVMLIKEYFGDDKSFGFVSNRIHSYSTVPTDSAKWKQVLPNLAAYGVVIYDHRGMVNVQFEKKFCKSNHNAFQNLEKAVNWVKEASEKTAA